MKNVLSISLVLVVLTICLCACDSEKVSEPFSAEKPYSALIKSERSYYQAAKIEKRLNKMGIASYVIEENEDDGTWYRILAGAIETEDSVLCYFHVLDSVYGLSVNQFYNYNELDSITRIPIASKMIEEESRIEAKQPDVQPEVMQVVRQFPENSIFYLKSIALLPLNAKAMDYAQYHTLDMPCGLTLQYLKKHNCSAFASVIYEDNLFGDQVTLQVTKYQKQNVTEIASFMPSFNDNNKETIELCSDIADKILESSNYKNEQKDIFELQAYTKLSGFKVTFDTKKTHRCYFVFTDEVGDYIYIAQTTKDNDTELLDFLSQIGRSDGLIDYDEFYNTFYTIASKQIDGDEYMGYYVTKLTKSYAAERGYQLWAKKMVGHWCADIYFNNEVKGVWRPSLFDILVQKNADHYYHDLYIKGVSKDQLIDVYGTQGAAIYDYNWWTGEYDLHEINFSVNRYILAISGSTNYSEEDLKVRAQKLQLTPGGYLDQQQR